MPLPDGVDPAELVERDGAEAMRHRVESSMPFVVFHVERILDRSELGSAEGRDRAAAELGPVLSELPPSSLREDLMRRVAGRLELSEGQLASLLSGAPRRQESGDIRAHSARAISNPAVRAERTFLAYCIALPEAGARALAALDPDEYLTSVPLRRAARHLAGQTSMPLGEMAPEDEELARVVADLVELAGRAGDVTEEHLKQQRLLLELARLDRAIRRARAEGGGDVLTLAREREDVQRAIRGLDARLEVPV